MKLSDSHRLLGVHNDVVFTSTDGTPPFSSLLADIAVTTLLQQTSRKKAVLWDPFCGNGNDVPRSKLTGYLRS